MAQQRARVEAMRARKLAEKLAKAKDAKRLAPTKPLTGKKAEEALEKFLSKRTKEKPKTEATKSRSFSGMSNAEIKAKYKDMSQDDKKKFGMQMHTAAMANRKKGGAKAVSTTAQPSAKPKAVGRKPVQSKVQKAVNATKTNASNEAVEGGDTISSENRKPRKMPSNPALKSQAKPKPKSNLNPQQRRKSQKRKGTDLRKAVKSFGEKLRLTYKKGQLVKRGNKVYRSDGKGKLTLVHRKQF